MRIVYVYALEALADWETAQILAELHSRRFFKKDAPDLQIVWVGSGFEPVTTMGGLKVVPQATVEDIVPGEDVALLLPGADTWSDPRHRAVVAKAAEVQASGGLVAAICGATVALAVAGMLNSCPHTSNGVGFLDMMAPGYKGTAHYVDAPSVADGGIITAAATGALPWARDILACLDVMEPQALEYWYDYFATGNAGSFFALMRLVSG